MNTRIQNIFVSIILILFFGAIIYVNWQTTEYSVNKAVTFYSFLILSLIMLLHVSNTRIKKNKVFYNTDIFLTYFIIQCIIIFVPFFILHRNENYIYYFSKIKSFKFSVVNEINIIIGISILFKVIIMVINKKILNFISNFILLIALSIGFQRYFYSSINAVIILTIISVLYMSFGIWKLHKKKYKKVLFFENLFVNTLIILIFIFSGNYIDLKIKEFSRYNINSLNINIYFAVGMVIATTVFWIIGYVITSKDKKKKHCYLFCIIFSIIIVAEIMFFLQWNYILFGIFILFLLIWSYVMYFVEKLSPWEEYCGVGYVFIIVVMIIADFMLYIGWIDLFLVVFDFILIMVVSFAITNDKRYRLCSLCFVMNILIIDVMYHFSFDWYFIILFLILDLISVVSIFFLHSFFPRMFFVIIPFLFILAAIPVVFSGSQIYVDIAELKTADKVEKLGNNSLLNSLIEIKAKPRSSDDIYSIELKWNDEEPKIYKGFNKIYTKLKEGTLKIKVIDSKGVYSFKRINYKIKGEWKQFDDIYPPKIDASPNGIYNKNDIDSMYILVKDTDSDIGYIIYNIENEDDNIVYLYNEKSNEIKLPLKLYGRKGTYTMHAYAIDTSFNLSNVITRTYNIIQ